MKKPKSEDIFFFLVVTFIALILFCLIVNGDAPHNSIFKRW